MICREEKVRLRICREDERRPTSAAKKERTPICREERAAAAKKSGGMPIANSDLAGRRADFLRPQLVRKEV